jgi:hypothetical protein
LQSAEKADDDVSTKRPADEAAASLNANDVLMLHRRLKMIQKRESRFAKRSKGIMSCFSFLFLGVPRHYAKRPFNFW